MKSLQLVVNRETYEGIISGRVSSLTKSITSKSEGRFVEYLDEEDGKSYRRFEEIAEREGLFALRPVHYDVLKISCIDASLPTIHKSVVSEEILFDMDSEGNFKEYDANGQDYLMASLRYTFY